MNPIDKRVEYNRYGIVACGGGGCSGTPNVGTLSIDLSCAVDQTEFVFLGEFEFAFDVYVADVR